MIKRLICRLICRLFGHRLRIERWWELRWEGRLGPATRYYSLRLARMAMKNIASPCRIIRHDERLCGRCGCPQKDW
jgi:hypothetical protein